MKKLVLFDLDGTLTNTLPDINEELNKTLRKFGYKEITVDETRKFVGNGAKKLVERALKGVKCDNFDEVLAYYNKEYNFCGSPKTYAYDGIRDCIKSLKERGVKVAVISNKPQDGAREVVNKFFGDLNFDVIMGQSENLSMKPDRAGVNLILKNLEVKRSDAVLIGDSEVDVLTAKNAEIDFIGALWGFRDEKILREYGGENFCRFPSELIAKIESL